MNAGYWISIALALVAIVMFVYNARRFPGDKRFLSQDQELSEATWRLGAGFILFIAIVVAGTTAYFTA